MFYGKLESLLIPNSNVSEKIEKNSYQLKQILTLFRNLISLIVEEN